jgi:hypothetical protein
MSEEVVAEMSEGEEVVAGRLKELLEDTHLAAT